MCSSSCKGSNLNLWLLESVCQKPAHELLLSTVGVCFPDKSQLLKEEIMGPRGAQMSLPLEVPDTVGGSLCSDSSFQNFPPPHPHLLIYHCYGWAGKEQEERLNKNSPETGDQESGLLLAAVSAVLPVRCSSFLTHKDVSEKGQSIFLLPFLFLLEE